jgi:hypothetical protein
MFCKTLPAYRPCAIILLLMAGAIASSAQDIQDNERPVTGAGNSALTAHAVRTGLFIISGEAAIHYSQIDPDAPVTSKLARNGLRGDH